MSKLIFLSHIHEERELALLLKNALEEEFGGFVDVFVSSDGISIPAGANFLKRIEAGLLNCVAAIYLISPKSITRQWVNFELGAVWIRNLMSTNAEGPEVPAMPFCHSKITPGTLPVPLNNLNGIVASEASQLEFAFRSIQAAVGGKGRLRTNFDELAIEAQAIEQQYMVGRNLREMLSLLPGCGKHMPEIMRLTAAQPRGSFFSLESIWVENSDLKRLHSFAANELKDIMNVAVLSSGTQFTDNGAVNGAEVTVRVLGHYFQDFKDELKSL